MMRGSKNKCWGKAKKQNKTKKKMLKGIKTKAEGK